MKIEISSQGEFVIILLSSSVCVFLFQNVRATMDKLVSSKKVNGALVISAGRFGRTPLTGNV